MGSYHFTLAEDDADALFLVQRQLMHDFPGSSFAAFTNAEDALDHLLNHPTDMLVTNHGMGAMNGAELIRQLRRRNFKFPIIMLSGNPAAEREALEAGASAFLLKTAGMEGLERLIHDLLPR